MAVSRRQLIGTLALGIVSASVLPAGGVQARGAYTTPRLPDSFDRLGRPLPAPFDPADNAKARLAVARKKARIENKLLLLELGANWCGYCRNLAGTMALPAMRQFVRKHFVELAIDIGRFDNNMDIAGRYDVDPLPGIPALLVIDPETDLVLNAGEVSLFAQIKKPGPQGIADWLAQWADRERHP